ncbi:Receptor-like kinase TMK3, partial [Linum grandiflorum]
NQNQIPLCFFSVPLPLISAASFSIDSSDFFLCFLLLPLPFYFTLSASLRRKGYPSKNLQKGKIEMKKPRRPGITATLLPVVFFLLFPVAISQSVSPDAAAMMKLRENLGDLAEWTGSDPCSWDGVICNGNRVTRIKISDKGIAGSLPPELANLTSLATLEVDDNQLTGPIPDLSGMSSLRYVNLMSNRFDSIPPNFFSGLSGLEEVYLANNPLADWVIPPTLKDSPSLKNFSAENTSLTGSIPDFLFNGNIFSGLNNLHLSYNYLQGPLPASSSDSYLITLWLNGQKGEFKLNGTITVLQNISTLQQAMLQSNSFTGPIPDFSGSSLQDLNVRDNQMTGFGYPAVLAQSWTGNNPCGGWLGVQCSPGGDVIVINLDNKGLTGSISPNFASIASLQKLTLSRNHLTGTIPEELTKLSNLKTLDVSHNDIHGKVPTFNGATVITDGNPNIGKDIVSPPAEGGGSDGSGGGGGRGGNGGGGRGGGGGGESSSVGKVAGSVIGVVCLVGLGLGFGVCLYCRKRKQYSKVQSPSAVVVHPRDSENYDAVKITIAGSRSNGFSNSINTTASSNCSADIQGVESGAMVFSIQVLREVTDNFSPDRILGRGGFGTVYRGEIQDGTKIAVKRMEGSVVSDKGLTEFMSEIKVLTQVRHRHLVSLLGYCLDGNEKILVYEYMPKGTLSRFLFHWNDEGLKPLEWTRRLTIALDVARAVEYMHDLAHESFIHRDLKPSNILLGDNMRAKVADFGLVRRAPEGMNSISTRLAGTFGYMAPEYAVTGRVTVKVDVFSFGVILMELITGRRALDETEPEESVHLVTWFRRKLVDKKVFDQVIDSSIEQNEETLASISTVGDLAGHCTAREPSQRPEMSHVVSTLSSLAELWKPEQQDGYDDDLAMIDFDMTLPQALKKWKETEGDDSNIGVSVSVDTTQTSISTGPAGFADSLQTIDGR